MIPPLHHGRARRRGVHDAAERPGVVPAAVRDIEGQQIRHHHRDEVGPGDGVPTDQVEADARVPFRCDDHGVPESQRLVDEHRASGVIHGCGTEEHAILDVDAVRVAACDRELSGSCGGVTPRRARRTPLGRPVVPEV